MEGRRNRGRKGGRVECREGGEGREGERKGVSRDFKRAILQSEVGGQSIAIDSSDCLLRHKQIKRRNLHKTSPGRSSDVTPMPQGITGKKALEIQLPHRH